MDAGIALLIVLLATVGGLVIFLAGVYCERESMKTSTLLFLIVGEFILLIMGFGAFYVGVESTEALKHLERSSIYEVVATTPTPDGEVLVQVKDLDIATDDDKRRKIGVFSTFPPEGHVLEIADERTFLIPSGSSLTETVDGRIVLVTPSGAGQVIGDTRKAVGK